MPVTEGPMRTRRGHPHGTGNWKWKTDNVLVIVGFPFPISHSPFLPAAAGPTRAASAACYGGRVTQAQRSPAGALLRALALCCLLAGAITAVFALKASLPFEAILAGSVLAGIPLLVAIHRGWVRFLAARRLHHARARARAHPDDASAHYELGVLCSLYGSGEESRAAFERTRELVPGHAAATVGLGHLHAEAGELDEALGLFTSAAESDPTLFSAHFGIGQVHRLREQHARAIQAYERALALEPEDPYTLHELARCHLDLGDAERATDYRDRAARLGVRDGELDRQLRGT